VRLKDRVATSGASHRAADYILAALGMPHPVVPPPHFLEKWGVGNGEWGIRDGESGMARAE
jgi:hypothetical protein